MRIIILLLFLSMVGCGKQGPTTAEQNRWHPVYESQGVVSDDQLKQAYAPQSSPQEESASTIEPLPLTMNAHVEKWMDYFQGRGRKHFERWLARSGRYVPMMKSILQENGLPEDLVYLSMIESGFLPYAYSRARAVGQWQFMYPTGVHYGLKVDWWIDERRDPEKSALAAAQFLKELYDRFDHWHLAAAGYNAGPGKIARAMRRYNTEDFWELTRYRYLKPETKNYVPKIIAAATLAKNPTAYGFDNIEYQEPLVYEKVQVPHAIELKVIANAMDVPLAELKKLNPELLREVTPPRYPNYELKVPVETKGILLAKLHDLPKYVVKDVITHRIRSGESLSVIASKYGLSATQLARFNGLASAHRIRAGKTLKIPVTGSARQQARVASRSKNTTKVTYKVDAKGKYRVQSGDSFWTISRAFSMTVTELRRLNPQVSPKRLRPGQLLSVKTNVGNGSTQAAAENVDTDNWKYYRVRKGDNLWVIARRLGLSMDDLAQWNDLHPKKAVLHPGKQLRFKM
jgi:membrane-bound lytic murein transglycosylase D